MGKKKYDKQNKPESKVQVFDGNRTFIAIMPWSLDKNGKKVIDLGDGHFITPETEISFAKNATFGQNMVVAKDVDVVMHSEGLLFYGKTDQQIADEIIKGKSSSGTSIGYNIDDIDDKETY